MRSAAAPGGEGLCPPPPLDQLSSGGVAAGFTRPAVLGAFTGGDMSHLAGMAGSGVSLLPQRSGLT